MSTFHCGDGPITSLVIRLQERGDQRPFLFGVQVTSMQIPRHDEGEQVIANVDSGLGTT